MVEMILDKVNLVTLNCNIWQGKKAMTAGDLATNGIDISKLPPSSLASLGSKRIVNTDAIAPFNVLKREAARACSKVGVRFGSCGYAIPEDKMEELCSLLKGTKAAFEAQREQFLTDYDENIESWIRENPPEWEQIIRSSADSVGHVKASLSFKFAALKIKAPDGNIENGLEEEVKDLYGQLCHEIRVAAKTAYEASYSGKTEVTQRALRPIVQIREKLMGLGFLDVSLVDTIRDIDDVINCVPAKGPISGKALNLLSGLLGNQLMHLGRPKVVAAEEPLEEVVNEEEMDAPAPMDAEPVTTTVTSIDWDF